MATDTAEIEKPKRAWKKQTYLCTWMRLSDKSLSEFLKNKELNS